MKTEEKSQQQDEIECPDCQIADRLEQVLIPELKHMMERGAKPKEVYDTMKEESLGVLEKFSDGQLREYAAGLIAKSLVQHAAKLHMMEDIRTQLPEPLAELLFGPAENRKRGPARSAGFDGGDFAK